MCKQPSKLNLNALAKSIVDQAAGQTPENMVLLDLDGKNPAAVLLARLGVKI